MAHVRMLVRLTVEWIKLVARKGASLSDEEFLEFAYRTILGRDTDAYGRQYYSTELSRHAMRRRDIVAALLDSAEYKQMCGLSVHPAVAQHEARMTLIRDELPPAKVILDLGGAAEGHSQGALLAMGYPHRPEVIWIVDLAPEQRIGPVLSTARQQDLVTSDGIHVRYLFRSMTDLASFDDASVDLVWSGESIEHVTEAEAEHVVREVYRILRPGGMFGLDTPNAALTRIQSPDKLIHPEHKKEYYVSEMRSMMANAGFRVAREKGICPMPKSLGTGVFSYEELVAKRGLSDEPEEAYMFFLLGVKPDETGQTNAR